MLEKTFKSLSTLSSWPRNLFNLTVSDAFPVLVSESLISYDRISFVVGKYNKPSLIQ